MKYYLKRTIPLLGALAFVLTCCTRKENPFRIGFESERPATLPRNWTVIDEQNDYKIYSDSLTAHSGKRSLLLECRNNASQPALRFGRGFLRFPVDFKGSQVTLAGYIKTENVKNGFGGLLLWMEGEREWFLVKSTASEKIGGTGDWKRYEIKLPLKSGAREIYAGAFSTGSGKVWVDDLELLVDGKEPGAGGRIDLPPALKDTAFQQGSGVVIDSLSPRLQHDLVVLGKVWGFLKYYHPAVAAGQYNWDFELFRVLPGIVAAANKQERNAVLLKWLNGLKQVGANNKPAMKAPADARLLPELDWLTNYEELGEPLSAALEAVRRSSANERHFYLDWHVGGDAAFNESRYRFLGFPDDGYRLLALYRYWNIIQYYYPYRHLIGENWEDVLNRFIPAFVQTPSAEAYQFTAMKLIASIHDSHAFLTENTAGVDRFIGNYVVPAEVLFVEGKATVVSVPKDKENQPGGLLRGDVILAVNGHAVQEIQERLGPYISASNEPQRLFGIASRLLKGNDSTFNIRIMRDGNAVDVKLLSGARQFAYPAFDYRLHPGPWKVLPGNIGYIFPGTLKRDDIPQMMKELWSTKAIIIDIRCYPMEMIGDALCRYFTDKRVEFAKAYYASMEHPGLFEMRPAFSVGGYNKLPYLGKVVVLVNEFTESRAEYLTMALKAMPNATVIGGVTAGTDGDASEFYLPGGLKTRITGVGYCWPDGSETQRIGIIPDILVKRTLKGVRAGKDEQLDAALLFAGK
ncbi:S41 family peptidase [Chitinophaga sp. GCM10012297]|uniref:Tail specific protease domain-containing protein n=1 Tax=Chitinophaga chungangae TaxID=2821488 RepID=A0ABS3Y9J2_9BACT|nr:S41 family peptidase [Chitinophaga chungangae]MBO9151348.1 hypothetical protein [Chitinophaga chungangae]